MDAKLLSEEAFDGIDARIVKALFKMGISKPSLIQANAIPLALQGKDIVAKARTGSGKTAAYCIPILQKLLSQPSNGVKAVILVPTKELAQQVTDNLGQMTVYCKSQFHLLNVTLVQPSIPNETQNAILVSTPTKLLHYIHTHSLPLKETLDSVVLDEADLILSYGYEHDLTKLLELFPQLFQSYLMSATLSPQVKTLKQMFVRNPAVLKLEESDPDDLLVQYYVKCLEKERFLFLYFIMKLKIHPFGDMKTLIFVNDVDQCYKLKLFLEQFGVSACVLNAELPIKSRCHIVHEFNQGVYDIVIATDQGEFVQDDSEEETEGTPATTKKQKSKKKTKQDSEFGVARGIDFKNVQAVINFDLPASARSYMHRVGRTARGLGNKGYALSFVTTDNSKNSKITETTEEGQDLQITYEEYLFNRIVKRQKAIGRDIQEFKFDMTQVSRFAYRMDDALRAVTKASIKEARLKELKSELLNSEKLKAHFEDNPKDVEVLKHDKMLHPARVQPHMKHIPGYLMPKRNVNCGSDEEIGEVKFREKKRRRVFKGVKGKMNDPLKSFKV